MLLFLAITLSTCGGSREERTEDGRLILNYWEKWTGFEEAAMQKVVDDFNQSQNRLFVRYVPTASIDKKMLVAAAGGDPPDIAGVWSWIVNTYADRGAIIPLDDMIRDAGISEEDYIPFFYRLGGHRGKMWALPTTPATVALHWNKRLFREAGLDPDKPPRTIAELDEMAERLTFYQLPDGQTVSYRDLAKMEGAGRIMAEAQIVQLGFLPNEPGWWNWSWVYFFGGELWNGRDALTATSAENVAAMRWAQGYSVKYGKDNINRFCSGFAGQFASSQNAFLSGRIAMIVQGVWMYNFISKYSPGLEWGAAAFPSADTSIGEIAVAECDVLVIPKGAPHPRESFEFIRFVQQRKNMEKLCIGHRKFSPLSKLSPDFYRQNPHPCLSVFRDLALHARCITTPNTSVWPELGREFTAMFDKIRNLEQDPEPALADLQARVQKSLDREIRSLKRKETTR